MFEKHASVSATIVLSQLLALVAGNYKVGVGIADMTGPAAEVGMMGYAKTSQVSTGIHTRLFSRAFVFDDGINRAVFVSMDAGMVGHLVKRSVIERLKSKFGDLYSHENVVLSATHTHSGPAGFMQYVLFNISHKGFIFQSYYAMVVGIVESIVRAHSNVQPARLFISEGRLAGTSVNRSPTSYLANPAEERARYDGDTDQTFTQLSILSSESDAPLGLINWFAVHGTSMNSSNLLISGDNKGLASVLFEKEVNRGRLIGKGPFVAAFASSALGDVSPNTLGPQCRRSGLPCHAPTSSCPGRGDECLADGPGRDMADSTRIIAERQFWKARELFEDASSQRELTGPLKHSHQWIDMARQPVRLPSGGIGRTCKPALGYSFAAGTTDGSGEPGFKQGTTVKDPFWDTVVQLVKSPTEKQKQCHLPKPILLDTGEMSFPHAWSPEIVTTQMLRLGDLLIIAGPGEFTTMAGRRMREEVLQEALSNGAPAHTKVVLAGLSNIYTHYTTTYEEYQRQRYEAASTLYGPNTLRAYQQQYQVLTEALYLDHPLPSGPSPPDLSSKLMSFDAGVIVDTAPINRAFGDCVLEPPTVAFPGATVLVKFISGHPRNNLMLEGTFLTVENQFYDGTWTVVATDADWETRFVWKRKGLAESEVSIFWTIPEGQSAGLYRIRHFGHYKVLNKKRTVPYIGQSRIFEILPSSASYGQGNRRTKALNDVASKKEANSTVYSDISKFVEKYFKIKFL